MTLSVIICTHNPRPDYLARVIEALKAQTLPRPQWELLLIDNASQTPLASAWDLSWHPQARHIREEELGLTPARLRGIRESKADLLVFVDDDNVLAADYLCVALELAATRPWVGAFGGGCAAEFDTPPDPALKIRLDQLAIIEVKDEAWACGPGTKAHLFVPWGTGLIIRRRVAVHYAQRAATDPLRRSLDRKGTSLASAGDVDMVLCACCLGLAVGRFPQLSLKHLLSANRLERAYRLRLAEEMGASNTLLEFIWDGHLPILPEDMPQPGPCRSERLFRAYQALRHRLGGGGEKKLTFEEELDLAARRGVLKAVCLIQARQRGDVPPGLGLSAGLVREGPAS